MRGRAAPASAPAQPRSSGGGARRCDVCGCVVPAGIAAWETHVAGIRHRRNAASVRVCGEPGHAVVSAFEALDAPPPRYRGRDEVLLRRASASRGRQGSADGREQPELLALQQEACKHLASVVGVGGGVYSRASGRFTLQALQEAAAALAAELERVQQQQQAQQQQQQPLRLELSLQEPAQVACLAQLLPARAAALRLTVPYQSYGPSAAATSAAVACFAASLARRHDLAALTLEFDCADHGRLVQQGGTGLERLPQLWGHVVAPVLSTALQVNSGLSSLTLAAFPGQFPPDVVSQLLACVATCRARRRLAVLLGTHSRAGAASPLRGVPVEVLGRVLAESVPPGSCTVALELPRRLAGDSSSESESGSESGSDESD
ncbi:hypothetical protein HT031_002154 [Scenedesmus sp. PABB004]|nr:hypothetical protein HT031_002154 [Scenedesmus sp. PABB004]